MSKVLVADDEEIIRELAKEVLEAEGYEVVTAEDGSAALSKIAEGGIDLLLTDIKMPEIDGLRLIREARKVTPDLPSIIMTGYATIETARKAIRSFPRAATLKCATSGSSPRFRLWKPGCETAD